MHVLAVAEGQITAKFVSFESRMLWLILVVSLAALAYAYYLVREVLAASEGTEKMREIARSIQIGAAAYLKRQYRTLGVFMAVLTVALFFILPVKVSSEHSSIALRFGRSIAFILGATFS